MATYNHLSFEKKWQDRWDAAQLNKVTEDPAFPPEKRFYILDMFPYPSGAGLHVGHPEGYTASDILGRYKKMKGFNVLHPMGWDAFGLPAENYAIKTGIQPRISTQKNIENFKRQIKAIGFAYDWDREIDTTDPHYVKWTQWVFLQLYKKGLAYEATFPINWCPSCKTGLANEEVVDGKCDRCNTVVGKKNLRQWMLKITAYAERLLADLDTLDWPEPIKHMQRNWIGRSEGAAVTFVVDNLAQDPLVVFTTRPDTLFGATYMVISPEHPLVVILTTEAQKEAMDHYLDAASKKSDTERVFLSKTKTGVFTGSFAINPVNGSRILIWVADYVLSTYGTGAIMAVPAHDERDFEFAKTFDLPIIPVVTPHKGITPVNLEEAAIADGFAINSGVYDGMPTASFKKEIIKVLEAKGQGVPKIQFKLRDWVFSRQRYWGEPIPVIHCPHCGIVAVPDDQLPVLLPEVDKYEPSGTGESPLVNITDWVNTTCPTCGGDAKRETNTMPQWAGSSWYYLRYIDPHNDNNLADMDKLKYWLPVDSYIGGAEHAVLHLLYSRFWHQFLYDIEAVPTPEPYQKLTNQGLIMGEDGQKMSKSLGNVVNPDDVIEESGADVLRLYEMFMGPLEQSKPWSMKNISGTRRFLEKVWRIAQKPITQGPTPTDIEKVRHQTIKKVSAEIEGYKFNTAISQLMIYANEFGKEETVTKQSLETLLILLAPFAPHITEELWEMIGNPFSIHQQPWPTYDESQLVEDTVTIVFMVNGKLRASKDLPPGISQSDLLLEAKSILGKHIEGKTIVKEIVVPKKLVNFVVR